MSLTSDHPTPKRPNYRDGKQQIGVHLKTDTIFVIQELLLRLSRERGKKLTMQEALEEAVVDYCRKHKVELTLG